MAYSLLVYRENDLMCMGCKDCVIWRLFVARVNTWLGLTILEKSAVFHAGIGVGRSLSKDMICYAVPNKYTCNILEMQGFAGNEIASF